MERIDIVGNRRFSSEELRSLVGPQLGQPYSEARARQAVEAIRKTRYFGDVRLEVEKSIVRPDAVVLIYSVIERPVIRHITYKGIRSVSHSEILERYRARSVFLALEGPFDPSEMEHARLALLELLREHGRPSANVTPEFSRIYRTHSVEVRFIVEEGRKSGSG